MEHKSELKSRNFRLPGMGAGSICGSRLLVPDAFLELDIDLKQARLADVIADEIVPRLLFFHHHIRPAPAIERLTADEIAEFAVLTFGPDGDAVMDYFDKMRASGYTLETLFVHLLAPTARYLGELWNQDLCDFVDVTIGVARLRQLMSIFGATDEDLVDRERRRVLLLTTSKEPHVFGLEVIARFMRAANWDVSLRVGLNPMENAALTAQQSFDVVGISLSCQSGLEATARTIKLIRRTSRNVSVGVMVGGPVFDAAPELAVQVGADAMAADAPAAVAAAKALVLARANRR